MLYHLGIAALIFGPLALIGLVVWYQDANLTPEQKEGYVAPQAQEESAPQSASSLSAREQEADNDNEAAILLANAA